MQQLEGSSSQLEPTTKTFDIVVRVPFVDDSLWARRGQFDASIVEDALAEKDESRGVAKNQGNERQVAWEVFPLRMKS